MVRTAAVVRGLDEGEGVPRGALRAVIVLDTDVDDLTGLGGPMVDPWATT